MKPFRSSVFISTIIFVCCFILFAESTMCKPLSTFKIDCNVCTCSSNGHEYSCTEQKCPGIDWSKFEKEVNEDGYVLLKPKQTVTIDDNDFVLTRKAREANIDDEIFLSGEDESQDIDI